MRESIGWHLAESLANQAIATELALRVFEIESARHEGAAAGHAFRAAELAYDLGQRHAEMRRRRTHKAV
jgi:hypothetical protein